MAKGTVKYTIGECGEIMRLLPSGQVSFSDSLVEAMRDMHAFDAAGYEVLIDGEPLVPKTGFLGWLHRMIDKLPTKGRKGDSNG